MGVIKRLLEQRSRIWKQGMYVGGVTDFQYFRDLKIQTNIHLLEDGQKCCTCVCATRMGLGGKLECPTFSIEPTNCVKQFTMPRLMTKFWKHSRSIL